MTACTISQKHEHHPGYMTRTVQNSTYRTIQNTTFQDHSRSIPTSSWVQWFNGGFNGSMAGRFNGSMVTVGLFGPLSVMYWSRFSYRERPREARRSPESLREAQRSPERPRESQRGPERPMYVCMYVDLSERPESSAGISAVGRTIVQHCSLVWTPNRHKQGSNQPPASQPAKRMTISLTVSPPARQPATSLVVILLVGRLPGRNSACAEPPSS